MRTVWAVAFAAALLGGGRALAGGEIHGTVHLRHGDALTGPIRWGGSESFWDDWLDAVKPDPITHEGDHTSIRFLFWKVADLEGDRSRIYRSFNVPFGELSRIEHAGNHTSELTLRNGDVLTVEGWGTELGPELILTVDDPSEGRTQVPWDRIESIEFSAGDGSRDAERLYGTVASTAGTFTGFILWDRDEAMLEDVLDGEEDHRDRKVAFRDIAWIERASSRASRVGLRDGQVMELRGTNDVDRDNRGIEVQVEGLGRLVVDWDLFERLDLQTPPASRGYETYDGGRPIRGTVTTHDGRALTGRIVWDEDETYTWEVLDGIQAGIDYEIPFRDIHSIMPGSKDDARVRLRGGDLLVLDGHKDVSADNEGIVVHADDGTETELDWADVRLVTFEP